MTVRPRGDSGTIPTCKFSWMTFDIMCRLFIIMIPPAILRVLKAGSSMEEIIGLPDDLPPGQYRVNIYGLTAEFTLE